MNFEFGRIFLENYGYPALFAVAFFDGFHAMLIGGFLAALGYMSPVFVFIALFWGNVLSDITWFGAAYFGGEKILRLTGKYYGRVEPHMLKMRGLLEKYAGRIILTVKLTLGFSLAMVIAAGVSKMRWQKFVSYDFLAALGVTLEMTTIGYFFGASYERLREYYNFWSILVIIFFITGTIVFTYINQKRNEKVNG